MEGEVRIEWRGENERRTNSNKISFSPERSSNPRLAGCGTLYRAKLNCQNDWSKSIYFQFLIYKNPGII
jgi:hypothetical protein